jgi:EXLDI family protein
MVEVTMPNKTIYVSDDDLPVYKRAQELAGNLSAAISAALRRYVEIEEGREEGFEEIIVKVGPGVGRRQRFTGVLLAEWGRSTSKKVETFRVYRTRHGRYAVHIERSPDYTSSASLEAGWRSFFSADQTWGMTAGEATLQVVDSLEELRELIPEELYEMVAAAADYPAVEDLDI